MKRRDEWMFDGECSKCVLYKCCVLPCKVHKEREARKIDKRRGIQNVKGEQKTR